jgi:hypothetical protein
VAARREPKLVIDRIEWSADQLEFHSGAFPPDTPVWFRAIVKNEGTAGWPIQRPIKIDFKVNGELVSTARSYRSGLEAGAEIALPADGGPMGDRLWHNTSNEAQKFTVSATADPEGEFQQAATVEVQATSLIENVAVAFAQALGTAAGGPLMRTSTVM